MTEHGATLGPTRNEIRFESTDEEQEGIIAATFCEIDIAGERALECTRNGTRMIFGLGPAADGDRLEERRQRLLTGLEPPIRCLRWGHQIHGRVVASIASEAGHPLSGAACVGRCDALVTAESGIGLMVWTADCVPVLIEGDGVVAAVHSGWRGTAADIVGAVIKRFELEFGVPSFRLRAALGPAISGPRYRVGPEVVRALAKVGVASDAWRHGEQVDLRVFLGLRIRDLGVPESDISVVGPCTASTSHLASYRRDGAGAGRQFSLVYRFEEPSRSETGPVDGERRPRS